MITAEPVTAEEAIRRALSYHERTKHHLHRYARSSGSLDWATQPDPFRVYAGAERVELPLLGDELATSYGDLYTPGAVQPHPIGLESIALLFELALGLSAWKQAGGTRWALRCNPSSGNLHPTEGYAVVPDLPGLSSGLYHYVSRDHCLERRACFSGVALPRDAVLVGLSSVHWREAWKYGERAFRYCQHDAGHAIATVRYAAAALGWSATLLGELSDDAVAALLGLDRDEDFAKVARADREHPDGVLLVGLAGAEFSNAFRLQANLLSGARFFGHANPLSPSHVDWEIIDEVAHATRKTMTAPELFSLPPLPALALPSSSPTAAMLIRKRRSCLALDGVTEISSETFYAMLDHLLPRKDVPPFDALPWAPLIHAGLFVHRVRGLEPGLYLFERSSSVHERLRGAISDVFSWDRPPGCPDHLRLFQLAEADLRQPSQIVSCHQDIAAEGAFSLGMIADFGDTLRARGAFWYRRLFWEAGVLGQVLYLEAEAAGIRGTGIGCYFDDAFHEILDLTDDRFQSLYHFTIGGPVEDSRLTTLPPYAHLQRLRFDRALAQAE